MPLLARRLQFGDLDGHHGCVSEVFVFFVLDLGVLSIYNTLLEDDLMSREE